MKLLLDFSGNPPVRFGGRGEVQSLVPTPITGEDLSTRAMVEYFKPLITWLQNQNKGRTIGWY